MTFLIAAAGTGGHVYPGLSVGEGLEELGVDRGDILYVGGDRLEATVYPGQGYRFLQLELTGLRRSLSIQNLRIPRVVMTARARIAEEIAASDVEVVLGMGGYVTIPAALAARKTGVAFFNAEQNAEAGLGNRVTARWARKSFVSFPDTGGLPGGDWVGNPVRKVFWSFERRALRPAGLSHYGLSTDRLVLGVFGGSLGAGVINEAVAGMLQRWVGPPLQVVHLTGSAHFDELAERKAAGPVVWRRVGFEERMERFFAVSDVVIARAGGAVAELTATGTPSILVPGQFGSGGHQSGNARFLEEAGAAVVVAESELGGLTEVVADLVANPGKRVAMAKATGDIAKPDAARTIARTMIEAAR